MMRAPIATSLSTKNNLLSNIFSKMRTVPCDCVAHVSAIDVRSAGNAGQTPLSIFGIWEPRSSRTFRSCPGRDAHGALVDLHLDPELSKRRDDRDQVVGLDVLDRDVSARDRSERGEAGHLDVLRPDSVVASVQLVDAVDVEHVRADPFDLRAERDEEAAQVLDVRLAGSVSDTGLALGEDGGHDRVLRPHDRRFVEVHALALQAVGLHLVRAVERDGDTELLERVDVRVEPAAADDVAAGRRDGDPSEARKQRPGEKEGRAYLPGELGVEIGLGDALCIDADVVGPVHSTSAPRSARSSTIVSTSLMRGTFERRTSPDASTQRRENREGAVLVPRRPDGSVQRTPALDDEGLHRARNATRGAHGLPGSDG